MIMEDGTCDMECGNCEYENKDLECLKTIFLTEKVRIAIIETREPGDTISPD